LTPGGTNTLPPGLLVEEDTGVLLKVRVIPRGGASRIAGLRNEALLVRVAAAPVEGAANEALVAFLAGALRLSRRDVSLAAGDRSRDKRLRIRGITAAELRARLSSLLAHEE